MKFLIALTLLTSLSTTAFAAQKVCTVTKDTPEFAGTVEHLDLTAKRAVISPLPGVRSILFSGDFTSNGAVRTANGKKQIGFDGYDEGDGIEIWLDEALLTGSGQMEVTSHGEGDLTLIFECH